MPCTYTVFDDPFGAQPPERGSNGDHFLAQLTGPARRGGLHGTPDEAADAAEQLTRSRRCHLSRARFERDGLAHRKDCGACRLMGTPSREPTGSLRSFGPDGSVGWAASF